MMRPGSREEVEDDGEEDSSLTSKEPAGFTILTKWLWTDRPTDQQTNQQMDKASYREMWTYLKTI